MRSSLLMTAPARLLAAAVSLLTFSAAGADRVALVVGNGDYEHTEKLTNPTNDAESVATMLESLGFETIVVLDAGIQSFQNGLAQFTKKAEAARVGLFYFAGHGIEMEDRNYLLPVDAELEMSSDLSSQTVALDSVLEEMEKAQIDAKMVILDCCRDNPLRRAWIHDQRLGNGLSTVDDSELPESTMILFAARPGEVAADGVGENSPFTAALLSELAKPGRNAMDAFFAVSDTVVDRTEKRQEPSVKLASAGRAFRSFSLAENSTDPNSDDRKP